MSSPDELSDIREFVEFSECAAYAGRFAHLAWQQPDRSLGLCLTLMLLNVPFSILLLFFFSRLIPKTLRPSSLLRSLNFQPWKHHRQRRKTRQGLPLYSEPPHLSHRGQAASKNSQLPLTLKRRIAEDLGFITGVIIYLSSWVFVVLVPFLIQALQYCVKQHYSQAGLWAGYAICNVLLLFFCTLMLGAVFMIRLEYQKDRIKNDTDAQAPSPRGPANENHSSVHGVDSIGRSHSQADLMYTMSTANGTPPPPAVLRVRNPDRSQDRSQARQSIQSFVSRTSSTSRLPRHFRLQQQHFDASRAFSNPEALLNEAARAVEERDGSDSTRNMTTPAALPSPAPLSAREQDNPSPTGGIFTRGLGLSPRSSVANSTVYSSLRLPSPLRRSVSVRTTASRIERQEDSHSLMVPAPLRPTSMIEANREPRNTDNAPASSQESIAETGSVIVRITRCSV